MRTLKVHTKDEYEILIGDGISERIYELIAPFCQTKKVLIITDNNVRDLYANALFDRLNAKGYCTKMYVLKSGEQSKNFTSLSNILEFALDNDFHRNDLFLAFGGGVVGDIAGLASALYMRGLNFISVPTTLLSATDSSIGGKTAVNLRSGKNIAGVFKQPSLVIIDTKIIKNLPDKIFGEGMGEVLKCAVLKDLPIFEYIENGTVKENIESIILDCLNLKKAIVEKDEFDTLGIRNLLNVGHTAAHAIEKLSDYSIPHGKAVAMGLVIESRLANALGICSKELSEKIEKAVKSLGLYYNVKYDSESLAKACLTDKKNKDSRITFLLPEKIGLIKEVKLSLKKTIELL